MEQQDRGTPGPRQGQASPAPTRARVPADAIKLLLVEDEEVDREALRRFVSGRRLPFGITEADSLAEGRRQLVGAAFDAVIADLNLGDGSGLDLLLDRPDCPVVMLTGGGDEETAASAMRSGAYDYMVKASDGSHFELLEATIAKAMAQWRADRLERQHAADLARSHAELEKFSRTIAYALASPLRHALECCTELGAALDGPSSEDREQHLAGVRVSIERAQSLVQDLVDYAALTRNAEPARRIDAGTIVEEVLDDLADEIRRKGATVHVRGLPAVEGRQRQVRLLFQALIANAIDFSCPQQPMVKVSAERQKRHWRFRVSDNGAGVPSADRRRIFELFRRRYADAHRGGNGIGLAMARRIVEIHGGEIGVEPFEQGGAVFYFTLPAAGAEEAETS